MASQGERKAILAILLSATCVALAPSLNKMMLSSDIPPVMESVFLSLGYGLGVGVVFVAMRSTGKRDGPPLEKTDMKYLLAMAVCESTAIIFAMYGLSHTTASNVALLNNTEMVLTALLAMLFFKEAVGKRLWLAIGLMSVAVIVMMSGDASSFDMTWGSLLVVTACFFWSLESNITKKVAKKDAMEVTTVNGLLATALTVVVALFLFGEQFPALAECLTVMGIGLVTYGGMWIFFIYSLRHISAAKSMAIYTVNSFIAVLFAWILLGEIPTLEFIVALLIMIPGVMLAARYR